MTVARTKYRFVIKRFIVGIVVFASFLYISGFSHELGHIAVCQIDGFESRLYIDSNTFETRASTCFGQPENLLLLWAAGGISGMAVSLAPLALYKKYKFLIIGCIPNAVANAIAGIMETFAHEWYMNTQGIPALIATIPMLAIGAYLLLRYSLVRPSSLIS